jgi:hypothetical protein
MPTQTTIGKTLLRLVDGDIAEQDTDAVVTAAHYRLNMGTGSQSLSKLATFLLRSPDQLRNTFIYVCSWLVMFKTVNLIQCVLKNVTDRYWHTAAI